MICGVVLDKRLALGRIMGVPIPKLAILIKDFLLVSIA